MIYHKQSDMKRFTKSQIKRMLLRYKNGQSLYRIAHDMGVTPSGVRRQIVKAGIIPRNKKEAKARNDLPWEMIAESYQSGMSSYALAKQYQVNTVVIYYWLKTHGLLRSPEKQIA